MKTIKFSDTELESMIQMYKDQLTEAHDYVMQVQEILKKLGAKPAKEDVVEKQPMLGKKRGRKPAVKVVEKAEPKKRGRKPKVVLPSVESTIATKPMKKIAKKKIEPKKKVVAKAKVVVEKKSPTKPVVEKKPVPKSPATIESVVGSLLVTAPKKVVKKVTKKISPEQRRLQEMAASAKLSKPVSKKVSKVKPAAANAPIEPKSTPAEQS